DRAGQRADRRERSHAEEQAHQQEPQPAEPPVEVAPRDAPGCGPAESVHAALRAPVSEAIRPSASVTTRSHRAAKASSCVIMTRGAPVSARRENNRSMISAPVLASRLPVGSSAKMSGG